MRRLEKWKEKKVHFNFIYGGWNSKTFSTLLSCALCFYLQAQFWQLLNYIGHDTSKSFVVFVSWWKLINELMIKFRAVSNEINFTKRRTRYKMLDWFVLLFTVTNFYNFECKKCYKIFVHYGASSSQNIHLSYNPHRIGFDIKFCIDMFWGFKKNVRVSWKKDPRPKNLLSTKNQKFLPYSKKFCLSDSHMSW